MANIESVRGEACAYYVNVGLFGGPQNLRGCDQTAGGEESASPKVTLPADGSDGPITATDADGAKAVYGPATIHGGRWPCEEEGDRNCPSTAPGSGPQSASTDGRTGEGGSVTSSADIGTHSTPIPVSCYRDYGPDCYSTGGFGSFPVEGDSLHVQCTASGAGVSGSTTLSSASLATAMLADGSPDPAHTEDVPDKPPPNYTRHGVITNVGDVFAVVYNEQTVNSDGSLTVIGTHMYLFGPVAVGEVVRGKVTCGTTPSAISPADDVAPTCGTPVVEPLGPQDPTPKVPRTELIGVFDAGGLQSITNIRVTNGIEQLGKPDAGQAYLEFHPGQLGPLSITFTRYDDAEVEDLPMAWSFDATDAAGNTTHCSS